MSVAGASLLGASDWEESIEVPRAVPGGRGWHGDN